MNEISYGVIELNNINYEEFKTLPEKYQELFIKQYLPIENLINKHAISIDEIYHNKYKKYVDIFINL